MYMQLLPRPERHQKPQEGANEREQQADTGNFEQFPRAVGSVVLITSPAPTPTFAFGDGHDDQANERADSADEQQPLQRIHDSS